MSRLVCPFCGPRELGEFHFHKTLPVPGTGDYAAVYERSNRLDVSLEYWHHARGCHAWLEVERNPSTGDVAAVRLLGGGRP